MEFEEIKKLRKVFDKYLNYKGINLWMLSENLIYYHLLKNLKKKSARENLKDSSLRYLVKINNFFREKTKETGNKKSQIIFLVYNTNHVSTFMPIIKNISNMKIIVHDSPFSLITKKILEKNKIPYSSLDLYRDKELKIELKKAEIWLRKQWTKIKKDVELKTKISANYENILNTLKYFLKTRMMYLEMIRNIELLNKMYNSENNNLIIVADGVNPLGRSAVMLAKQRGIRSLVIQHGIISKNSFGADEIISDKTTVSGKREKNYLISKKIPLEKIEVTGQPRFDNIIKYIKKTKEEACHEINLNPKKKIIVFASQYLLPGNKTIKNAIEEFLRAVKQIENKENFEFIIKLHPGGGERYLKKIKGVSGVKIVRDIELYTLLRSCDILITSSSMVAIEAVLLNRPVITIEIDGKYNLTSYEGEGVGISIYEKNKLENAIEKVLYDKEFKKKFIQSRGKFIENFAYKLDGKSTDRIISLINKIMKD